MSLLGDCTALGGQRKLLEAKMTEFEGLHQIGDAKGAEACREAAHAFLDAWFDGAAGFADGMRRGRYMP